MSNTEVSLTPIAQLHKLADAATHANILISPVEKFFNGSDQRLANFWAMLNIHFLDYPIVFANQFAKTYCLLRSLAGEPLDWFLTSLQSCKSVATDALFSNWTTLADTLTARYTKVLTQDESFVQLKNVKMIGISPQAISAMHSRFNQLHANSGLHDTFALAIYREAIHPNLAIHLLREMDELPLNALQSAVERLSNLQFRQHSRSRGLELPTPSTLPMARSIKQEKPIFDFKTISVSDKRPWTTHLHTGEVAPVERAFRASKNLCRACGSSEHQLQDCSNNKNPGKNRPSTRLATSKEQSPKAKAQANKERSA